MSGASVLPVAGRLVGELDFELHLFLGGDRQRLGLGLERPALDEESAMIGERGERLPGLHLLAEPHLQLLHLVEGVAGLGRRRENGRLRRDIARLGVGDLFLREPEELKLAAQRFREVGEPVHLILLPGQVGGRRRAELDEPGDAVALAGR